MSFGMRTLRAIAFALLLVALGLIVNAYRRPAAPHHTQPPPPIAATDERRIAEHLSQAIRIQTISHQDASADDHAQFAALRSFLSATYPRLHTALAHEQIGGDGLLYVWPGRDPKATPILLLAHQDVVPVEPGSEARWTHPPFDGAIADGFVWGRGALDDKGPLIGLFEAIESLLAEGFQPQRTVYLASGFDEEVGGAQGALAIARELSRRNMHFSWVLDEGGSATQGIVPFIERPIVAVSVAEKGYVSVELVAHGEGGHSSAPPARTSVGLLAAAIVRLEDSPFEPRLLPIVRDNLETYAPEMPLLQRVALTNLWLTSPLVLRELARRRESNPSVRTTTAPTMLSAGVKENVLPESAHAIVNFRILPGESSAEVVDRVRRVIADRHVDATRLRRTVAEPAPQSSTTGPGYRALRDAALAIFPDAIATPGMTYGLTDSRHFLAIADDVYRFVPRLMLASDMKRMHGTDERASLTSLGLMVEGYRRILKAGVGSAQN
ncbi:MAG TPA: M20 family peptidase [Polyangiales bacterium]|jgi:carboxypeptidase PM20D1